MKDQNVDSNLYRTKDLAEAATLLVCKQKFVKIERLEQTCWFVFTQAEKCRKIADKFFFDNLLVPARQYHETLGLLKNRIFTNSQ
jgi:hypothetical protein